MKMNRLPNGPKAGTFHIKSECRIAQRAMALDQSIDLQLTERGEDLPHRTPGLDCQLGSCDRLGTDLPEQIRLTAAEILRDSRRRGGSGQAAGSARQTRTAVPLVYAGDGDGLPERSRTGSGVT